MDSLSSGFARELIWRSVAADKLAVARKPRQTPLKPRLRTKTPAPAAVAIVVRRGAQRRFEALRRKIADLPAVVTWDRRQRSGERHPNRLRSTNGRPNGGRSRHSPGRSPISSSWSVQRASLRHTGVPKGQNPRLTRKNRAATPVLTGAGRQSSYSPSNGNTMALESMVREEIRSPNRLKVPVMHRRPPTFRTLSRAVRSKSRREKHTQRQRNQVSGPCAMGTWPAAASPHRARTCCHIQNRERP